MAKRRRMTPARRRQILIAQSISARKRKKRSKDSLGYWIARGVRRTASMATMGLSSALIEFSEKTSKKKKKK